MPRAKAVKPPDVMGVIDLGAFGTKVLVRVPEGSAQCFFFPPHQCELMPHQINELEYRPTQAAETQMWIKSGERSYAVGQLAKVKFRAQLGLSSLKSESAIAKVLGAVWVLHRELSLPAKFTIALSVLLPPGEYADRDRFKRSLSQALQRFETPTGTVQVSLSHLACLPEGGGIAMVQQQQDPNFNQKTKTIAMIGTRNASALIYQGGVESGLYSCDLGFVAMVRGVLQRTSGYDLETLLPLIAQAGETPMPYHFVKVSRRSTEADRQSELQELVQAVLEARKEYLFNLVSWYREVLPSVWDELIFCGGTAEYLSSELLSVFQSRTQTVWFHGGVKLPEDLEDYGLGVRLSDPYAAFGVLETVVFPRVKVNHA